MPDESYAIPFGEAAFPREGDDVTIVAFSHMVNHAVEVADKLKSEGISVEVVDPRTTSPLDEEAILESVENTGRLVVVDESPPRCNMATDVAALVASQGFEHLEAPIELVSAPHTPVPFAPTLEQLYVPSPAKIEAAVRKVMKA